MKRGFTLIEILIVVAIIAVLASAVLVGLGPVQRGGRDARRISDLRQVQTALELYYNKSGAYPSATTWVDLTTALTGAGIGVAKVPNDPISGRNYLYGTNGTGYVLGADLEDANNSAFQNSAQGTIFGITNCGTAPKYCIQF